MTSKTIKLLIPIILLVASLMPVVYAPYDTASPTETADDAWITGIGAYFGDTPHLTLQDENVDVISGIRFRGVAVPQGAKINNATLFVRSTTAFPIGAVTVTVYGDDADDSAAFNDSGSFTRVYTNALSVWNVSNLFGVVIGNETITEIVQEIVDRPGWSSGNSLSLIILSTAGSPRRSFSSFDGFWETPWIEIYYDVEPTPEEVEEVAEEADTPYNDTEEYVWTYNETYRGIDIYIVIDYGDPEFQMYSVHFDDDAYYFNATNGDGSEIVWETGMTHPVAGCATTPILGFGQWTLIFADPGLAQLFVSDDEMVTSIGYNPNLNYPNLASYAGNGGSLAADPDNETIHLVYTSITPGHDAVYNVVYTNFTLTGEGVPVWASTYTNLTQSANSQDDPVIYVQKNGTLHVAYFGEQGTNTDQIWYRRRHTNGTWLAQVRVSDTDVALEPNLNPDVLANDETGDALVAWSYDLSNVHWEIIFPNNTVSPADRDAGAGRYPSMVNDRETNTANMVYQLTSSGVTYFRNKTITNSSSWSAAMQLSAGAQKHKYPDIGIDTGNRTLSVVWYNEWNEWTNGNWWTIGDTPATTGTMLITENLLFNFIEEEVETSITDTFIFLVYPNGTLVDTAPLEDEDDPEDVIDELLGGAQPEDPQEEDYSVIGKFRWKLLVLAVGMIMMLGAPIAGVYYGGDTATWIKILFIMFFGLGILWQIKSM